MLVRGGGGGGGGGENTAAFKKTQGFGGGGVHNTAAFKKTQVFGGQRGGGGKNKMHDDTIYCTSFNRSSLKLQYHQAKDYYKK